MVSAVYALAFDMAKKSGFLVVSLVSSASLLGHWLDGRRPGSTLRWILERAGYYEVHWFEEGLRWFHNADHGDALAIAAIAAGLIASWDSGRIGDVREATVSWALLVLAAEGLGFGDAAAKAILSFGAVLALGLFLTTISWCLDRLLKRDTWSQDPESGVRWSWYGLGVALGKKWFNIFLVPLAIPAEACMRLIVAYSPQRQRSNRSEIQAASGRGRGDTEQS